MDGDEMWSGDMGLVREGESRRIGEKILEMGVGGRR